MFQLVKISMLIVVLWPSNCAPLWADDRVSFGRGRIHRVRAPCDRIVNFQDQDVQRNAHIFRQDPELCLSRRAVSENGLAWKFTVISNSGHKTGPTIFLLHDNENTAFDAALYGVRKYGGKLVAVESGEKRVFQNTQDPNRNFGKTLSQTHVCAGMRTKPAAGFTGLLLDLQGKDAPFFLTMHNNSDGHHLGGIRGGVRAARRTSLVYSMLLPIIGDADDAVLLAGDRYLSENLQAGKVADYFRKAKINVIYERVWASKNDCSFSNFVVLNGLGDYYNIEAQHGHFDAQKKMLDALMHYRNIDVYNAEIK